MNVCYYLKMLQLKNNEKIIYNAVFNDLKLYKKKYSHKQ